MAHVPKYILARAKRLNKSAEQSEVAKKLAVEITHWLAMSGVPYADIPPYNRLVIALLKGAFSSEEDIKRGFDELLDW